MKTNRSFIFQTTPKCPEQIAFTKNQQLHNSKKIWKKKYYQGSDMKDFWSI